MGISTNAVLFYGYCWSKEQYATGYPYDDNPNEDWEDRYARLKGLARPATGPYQDFSAFYAAKRDLLKEAGCMISAHCSNSCLIPYVAITKSVKVASRGNPVKLNGIILGYETGWDTRLGDFCTIMQINLDGMTPDWFLVSYWG